ncbi:hypothetical protein OH76DRAFT_683530 [Lentinus brumalis]|uniref:Uncharacterized protein n=1 Tax=Lentinus brumalis TaxID=2498619 RepID=A0A371D6U8_9APHY|nr:hypothetical protein OH76DRAFT_683530 [Polyporus brumalis]
MSHLLRLVLASESPTSSVATLRLWLSPHIPTCPRCVRHRFSHPRNVRMYSTAALLSSDLLRSQAPQLLMARRSS